MNAIEMRNVTAGYDGVAAIRDVDLVVGAGELVAVLGANGAGKTTTVRAVCGLAQVHQGAVRLAGVDATVMSPRARARVGLATVPDERGLFTQLTVAENLRVASVRQEARTPLDSWFPELAPLLGRRAGLLSGGEQTMLALARAMIRGPAGLIVDEITAGLAPAFADAALGVLRRAASEWGCGVLLTEQSVRLALEVSDRAYVLRRGRAVLEGASADIAKEPGVLESSYLGDMG